MATLTKRTVDATKPDPNVVRFVWDDELKGLGLRVTPAGHKSYVFQYRLGGRAVNARRVTIGEHGAVTPDQARKEAKKMAGMVAAGRCPATEREAAKQARADAQTAPTIATLAAEFLADRRAKKKAGTVTEYGRMLNKDVLPVLGNARVATVTRAQVAKLHLAMNERPYLANRVLAVLSAMFRFAELHGDRPVGTNPCTGIEPYPERSRERYLSEEELKRFGAALTKAERTGLPTPPKLQRKAKDAKKAKHRPKSADTPSPANPFAVAALRFLILTGWREGEALGLRWDQLDFARAIAALPDTKTGRSDRHIGAPALALLTELPRLADSPYVFPGQKPNTHLVEIKRVWEAVRHAAKLEGVRLHDLRHSFASVGASGGLSLPMIGALLGHREVSTTQRYAHLGDDPRKAAADRVASEIAAAMRAEESTQSPSPSIRVANR
jgi:integrase